MNTRRGKSEPLAFRRAVAISVLLLVCRFTGCQLSEIEVHGTIISYDFIKLDRMKLTYFVKTKNAITQTGETRIRKDGKFKIRINREHQLPYYLIINGTDLVPDVSMMRNSIEIGDSWNKRLYMGNVYIYDLIKIASKASAAVQIRDVQVSWQSDIPDVDYYKLEIIGKASSSTTLAPAISISGIRTESFFMKSVEHALSREGMYQDGELEVRNNNASLEGTYFLVIYAIRQIGGIPVAVGKSTSLMISIAKQEEK